VVHATAWANAEYTSKAFGRCQLNGGSLTLDPTLNWDPWVKGIASFGFLVGYHNSPTLGEGRNPRISGTVSGLDGGVQAVVSVLGAPLFAQARKAFAADQGWILVLGSYLPIHPARTVTVAFLPTARWLDRKQGQVSFSAPPALAFPGGSAAYAGTAGFQDVALEVVVDWQLDERFHWVSSVSQRWLTGAAARTPLVATTTQRGFCSGLSIHL
jgi:outer membrane scaffolding protein for murein synthesis (MipA/OmpV family)